MSLWITIVWRVSVKLLLWFSLCSSHAMADENESLCTVCGESGPQPVPFPDQSLDIVGIPFKTCSDAADFATSLMADNDLCNIIHRSGHLCGCNVPYDGCTLCGDASSVPDPNLALPPGSDRTATTCGELEVILPFSVEQGTDQCLYNQITFGETVCGCPPSDKSVAPAFSSGNATSPAVSPAAMPPSFTPGVGEVCTICPHGGMGFPNKIIYWNSVTSALQLTCQDWDGLAGFLPATSSDCTIFRNFALECGCPLEQIACHLCPNGETVPNPDRRLNWLTDGGFVSTRTSAFQAQFDFGFLSCGLMASVVATDNLDRFAQLFNLNGALFCTAVQLKSWICGCSPDWRQIFLTWSYRLSGMLSLLGSAVIVYDIFRKPRDNRFTTYHQVVLGISLFDIIGSLAYVLVAVMAPHEAGFYLSRGNDATCILQGFMIQLGQTSMFYNICLALYFWLVISHNWSEHMFRRPLIVAHMAVVVTGVGLACGSIRFIGPQFGVCGVLPPLTTSQWQVSMFYTAPVAITLLVLTATTVAICTKVYRQEKKAQRWMATQHLKLTRRVFWQSFWYVIAFYMTLPFVLLTFYIPFTSPDDFWLLAVAAIVAPLQGFVNAFVYFKRSRRLSRVFQYCCKLGNGGGGGKKPTKTQASVEEPSAHENTHSLSEVPAGTENHQPSSHVVVDVGEEYNDDDVNNDENDGVVVGGEEEDDEDEDEEDDIVEMHLNSPSTRSKRLALRRMTSGVSQFLLLHEDWDEELSSSIVRASIQKSLLQQRQQQQPPQQQQQQDNNHKHISTL